MIATSNIRNRPTYFDTFKEIWRYQDTGNEAKSNIGACKCASCASYE